MKNPVLFFEIIDPDAVPLKRFYADLFGWRVDTANSQYGVTASSGPVAPVASRAALGPTRTAGGASQSTRGSMICKGISTKWGNWIAHERRRQPNRAGSPSSMSLTPRVPSLASTPTDRRTV